MNFTEFRFANTKRCRESFHPIDEWSMTDWACALGGEAGELLTFVYEMSAVKRIVTLEASKEAADVVAYLDLLCARLGIDLEAASISYLCEVAKNDGPRRRCQPMTITDFQKECGGLFIGPSRLSPDTLACGFGAATGELLNLIKKMRRGAERGDKVFLPDIAKAAARTLSRLSLLCLAMKIDLEKAVILKFNEVSARVGSSVKLK